jgi:hypothetical protein
MARMLCAEHIMRNPQPQHGMWSMGALHWCFVTGMTLCACSRDGNLLHLCGWDVDSRRSEGLGCRQAVAMQLGMASLGAVAGRQLLHSWALPLWAAGTCMQLGLAGPAGAQCIACLHVWSLATQALGNMQSVK